MRNVEAVVFILSLAISLSFSLMERPSYNTGTGFFVVGNKLYDANGIEFNMKGVNHLHWDFPANGIPNSKANIERWVIDFTQPTSTNQALMDKSIANNIVPIPGNWDATCSTVTGDFWPIIHDWVTQASFWTQYEKYMIYNIANEWGPPNSTVWRDTYISAVSQLREAGYLGTLQITSGQCGQDINDVLYYGKDILDSDPQKNIIFDLHIYGMWCSGDCQSWQTDLSSGLTALESTGLAIVISEFGPGNDIGPSPTDMTPQMIINGCNSHNFGWAAWAWDDPPYGGTNGTFALSVNGDFNSSADLTDYGKIVVQDPAIGLLATASPASIF